MNWKIVYRKGLGDEREVVVSGELTLNATLARVHQESNVTLLRCEPLGEQHPFPNLEKA